MAIISQAVFLLLAAGVSLLSAQGTDIPRCFTTREEFATLEIRLFRNADSIEDPNLQKFQCLSDSRRVRTFYFCPVGYQASIRNFDDSDILSDIDFVLDVREIQALPGNELEENVISCTPEDSTVAAGENSIEPCPDNKPTKEEDFTDATVDAERLCNTQCRVSMDINGIVIGSRRTNTVSCCDGAAPVVDELTGFLQCPAPPPPPPATNPPTTPTEAPPTTTKAPAPSQPSAPQVPTCSSFGSPFAIEQYIPRARSLVGPVQCSQPRSFQGSSGPPQIRTILRCREGEAVEVFRGLYDCPGN